MFKLTKRAFRYRRTDRLTNKFKLPRKWFICIALNCMIGIVNWSFPENFHQYFLVYAFLDFIHGCLSIKIIFVRFYWHPFVNLSILLYKVVRFSYLKLRISLATEPIGFFILGKLQIGPVMFFMLFHFHIGWF